MFTGLIEETVIVLDVSSKDDGVVLKVKKPEAFDDLKRGHSICVNGACLTVVNDDFFESNILAFDLGAETLKVTNHSNLKAGDTVHLERAMKMGARLHGHMVTGHVDEVCEVLEVKKVKGECLNLKIRVQKHPKYIWAKGSIVVRGVSLTLNEVSDDTFEVCLIPETLLKTNLKTLKTGDKVNIEYDFMAKGVIRAGQINKQLNS
jgi:riboflavin synthase